MRIKIDKLSFSYGSKKVLNDLSLIIDSGTFLSVIGKNGCGKSTLLKCLLKMNKIDNDMIFLDDIDLNLWKRFRNIGYVPQKTEFNFEFPITVSEILSSSYNGRHKDDFYKNIINSLELNKFYHENINNLSGGQLQRIFIARALLTKPRLLILDEPTIGIDNENILRLHNILADLKKEKVTIILVTHNLDFCHDLTDLALYMHENGDYQLQEIGGNNE